MNASTTDTSKELGQRIRKLRLYWLDVCTLIEEDFRAMRISRPVRDESINIAVEGERKDMAPLRRALVMHEMKPHTV